MVRQERKAADEAEESAEEARKKGRIIADLSEQLKESDDRIQDLTLELDSLREKQSADFATNNQESISKFVVVKSNQSISQALFLCAPFLSKKENVHLFSISLPRLDKCHKTS